MDVVLVHFFLRHHTLMSIYSFFVMMKEDQIYYCWTWFLWNFPQKFLFKVCWDVCFNMSSKNLLISMMRSFSILKDNTHSEDYNLLMPYIYIILIIYINGNKLTQNFSGWIEMATTLLKKDTHFLLYTNSKD